MVNMIVLTEIFLIYKHGGGEFQHAFFTWEAMVLLGMLGALLLTVLIKIGISEVINGLKERRIEERRDWKRELKVKGIK